jgi:NTP pyrophosphatase (non-canonical NTP hydrolase)
MKTKIQQEVKKYLDERGWNHLAPANMAKSIMIEGAELLELFQWDNYTVEQIQEKPELQEKIKKEIADVMIYCTELAVHLNLDIEDIILYKLKLASEKYKAAEVMKHIGEKTEDSFYLKKKLQYRTKKKN